MSPAGGLGPIVSTTSEHVVLTFDDGPDLTLTPSVLDVLDRHGSTATFFVLLSKVERHRELLDEVLGRGHEVGLHGPDHVSLPSFGHRAALERTRAARRELSELAGAEVRWFRPPYGAQSWASHLAVRRAGMTSVLWSATTWDWKQVPPEQRLAKAMEGARPGTILLAHDGTIGPDDGVAADPAVDCDRPALLDAVLTAYAERGLRGRSLGAALQSARPVTSIRSLLPRPRR